MRHVQGDMEHSALWTVGPATEFRQGTAVVAVCVSVELIGQILR